MEANFNKKNPYLSKKQKNIFRFNEEREVGIIINYIN